MVQAFAVPVEDAQPVALAAHGSDFVNTGTSDPAEATGLNLGADPKNGISVVVGTVVAMGNTPTVSSVTIAGQSATILGQISFDETLAFIAIATGVTSSSGTVSVNLSTAPVQSDALLGVQAYRKTGGSDGTSAADTVSEGANTDVFGGAITVGDSGAIVGVCGCRDADGSFTWANVTEDTDQTSGSGNGTFSAAHDEFATGSTPTVEATFSLTRRGSMVAVAFDT